MEIYVWDSQKKYCIADNMERWWFQKENSVKKIAFFLHIWLPPSTDAMFLPALGYLHLSNII